jgi:NAD(P)-dependent dehydrogenase (short-subunit alcohol dehydrogenase family)
MSGREIDGSVALVTGANRGLGRAITEALLERGVAKVYAAARKPEALADLGARHEGRLEVVELDVTEGDQVRAAAERAGDVQVLFNNAGVAVGGGLTDDGVLEGARLEMEVNYFAPLQLLSSFGPILAANGGGAIVNVASIAGLSSFPFYPTYSASKAAAHSLTQAARALLAAQGTAVYGVYPGPVDTDMASEIEMEKASPADVANAILDGVESGTADIFPDPFAVGFGQQFHASPKASEEQLAAMLADA